MTRDPYLGPTAPARPFHRILRAPDMRKRWQKDPWPTGEDDTDLDFYGTPTGNIWRLDTAVRRCRAGCGTTSPPDRAQPGYQRAHPPSASLPAGAEPTSTSWTLIMQLNEDLQRPDLFAAVCINGTPDLTSKCEELRRQRFGPRTGWVPGQRCAS